ncbi:MAG: hypothetical protein HPY69_02415 [Armatimonadetes bacterium]|nr:hypothetical protein [Armatimonadota bacterium]
MLPRERVRAMLDFQPPDIVCLECHPSTAGMHEHREKLQALFRDTPHDFGDFSNLPIPDPDPQFIQPDGSYCELRTDAWGVVWKHLVFGIWGHPEKNPLDDWAALETWQTPTPPTPSGPEFEVVKESLRQHRETYYLRAGWGSILEVMRAVRRFEDCMVDLALNSAEINKVADMIAEHDRGVMEYYVAAGVDGVQIGDDLGTQEALMISRDMFRRFFLPRYQYILEPAREAGLDIFFHTCGQVWDLLPDLAELGVNALWPQINLYDWPALRARCRELGMAIQLHPERSHVMTFGTPEAVTKHVDDLVAAFRPQEGGSWLYIEIDNGFPWENVEALFEAVRKYR